MIDNSLHQDVSTIAKNIEKAVNALGVSVANAVNNIELNKPKFHYGASKMKTAQQHAQEILPLVTAQANGEVIQMYVETHGWIDCKESTAFFCGCKYRVKPKTILVNGFEVPEPMREKPNQGDGYYYASISVGALYGFAAWTKHEADLIRLTRGICHTTKEAAIAHAKAMLGIDPNE